MSNSDQVNTINDKNSKNNNKPATTYNKNNYTNLSTSLKQNLQRRKSAKKK